MKTYILVGFTSGFVAAILFLAILVVIHHVSAPEGMYCTPDVTLCVSAQ